MTIQGLLASYDLWQEPGECTNVANNSNKLIPILSRHFANLKSYAIFGIFYPSLKMWTLTIIVSSSEIFPLTLVEMAKDENDFAVLKATYS